MLRGLVIHFGYCLFVHEPALAGESEAEVLISSTTPAEAGPRGKLMGPAAASG